MNFLIRYYQYQKAKNYILDQIEILVEIDAEKVLSRGSAIYGSLLSELICRVYEETGVLIKYDLNSEEFLDLKGNKLNLENLLLIENCIKSL